MVLNQINTDNRTKHMGNTWDRKARYQQNHDLYANAGPTIINAVRVIFSLRIFLRISY